MLLRKNMFIIPRSFKKDTERFVERNSEGENKLELSYTM